MTDLEIEKMQHEIELLRAQTNKANKEVKWYEVVLFTALGGVLVGIGGLIFKSLGA